MQILPFLTFALATSGTPGPNNILIAATAARVGVRATVPMVGGVALGFPLMIAAVGVGVSGVLAAAPWIDQVLRWGGLAWLLWLAWRIGSAPPPRLGEPPRRSPGFWGMAAFQWINPKAWLMSVATTTTWLVPGQGMVRQLVVMAGIFGMVSFPTLLCWAGLGATAGRLLGSDRRVRTFNVAMALLLVASMLPVVLGH